MTSHDTLIFTIGFILVAAAVVLTVLTGVTKAVAALFILGMIGVVVGMVLKKNPTIAP